MTSLNGTHKSDSQNKHTIVPITVTHPESVDIAKLHLFRDPPWILRLTIEEDRSYIKVKIVRAAPLTHPDKYISFLDAKDEEICMLEEMDQLDKPAQAIIKDELDRRYLTATVESILAIRYEYGTSYWQVQTDRGQREFVVQNVAENAQWLGESRLLVVDVDGNRFEIPDLSRLDKKSAGFIDQVL